MKEIDLTTWERKEHFNFFRQMDYPHFNVSFNLDITGFLAYIKEKKYSFYYSMIYYVTHTVNKIDEFKYRIRDGKVYLPETIHPSFTDMGKNESLFKIVTVDLCDSLAEFVDRAAGTSREQKEYFPFEKDREAENLIYVTCLPWVSFTQLQHPVHFNQNDSVPRISWGKYFTQDNKILLPFSIQMHHGLADGYHIGLFKELLEKEIR